MGWSKVLKRLWPALNAPHRRLGHSTNRENPIAPSPRTSPLTPPPNQAHPTPTQRAGPGVGLHDGSDNAIQGQR
jgi:hypothetical protein